MVLLAVAILAGPRTAAAYDKAAFVAPADKALVVFVQNLRQDEKEMFVVFRPNMECVAKVRGGQAAVVPMIPAKHRLYVTSYDTFRIDLDLEAGRSYFIRLHTVEKALWRVSHVTPVRRGADSLKDLKRWLAGANVVRASGDQCQGKPLQERTNRTQRRVNDANDEWKSSDDAYRARYTVNKEDGLTREDVGKL